MSSGRALSPRLKEVIEKIKGTHWPLVKNIYWYSFC
jgi:hypothetical protein